MTAGAVCYPMKLLKEMNFYNLLHSLFEKLEQESVETGKRFIRVNIGIFPLLRAGTWRTCCCKTEGTWVGPGACGQDCWQL